MFKRKIKWFIRFCIVVSLAFSLLVVMSRLGQASSIDLNESNTTFFSPVMNFDELSDTIAKRNSISSEEAAGELVGDDIIVRKEAKSKQYRIFKERIKVTDNYEPELNFYCETTESGLFRGIKRVLRVEINNLTKQFNGTLYISLETPNSLFYIFNGDFYSTGETAYNPKLMIDVERQASIQFNTSSASHHYDYKYAEGRLHF